ncbi:MAG: MBL fold metallo-hydrolase [Bacteroidota bacterium]
MKSILLHSLLICSLMSTAQVAPKEELIKLKTSHYLIKPSDHLGNVGVFNGKQRLILIDDQTNKQADRIKQLLKKITPRKLSLIINTSFHPDHTNGNLIFGAENTSIVAHENARLRMQKGRPTITFIERMQLYDDLETIELTHVKQAVSDGDIIVQFKQANVFYTGDLFVRNGLPPIDEKNGGDIYGLIHALNYLINVANEQSIIVPGHGTPCGLKELRTFRDMITGIRNTLIQLARQKKNEEEILREMESFIEINSTLISKKAFTLHALRMVQKHERI